MNIFAIALLIIGSMDPLAGMLRGVAGLGLVMLEIVGFLTPHEGYWKRARRCSLAGYYRCGHEPICAGA